LAKKPTLEETKNAETHHGNSNLTGSVWSRFASGTYGMGSCSVTINSVPNIVVVFGSVSNTSRAGITCNITATISGYGGTIASNTKGTSANWDDLTSVVGTQVDVPVGTYTYSVSGTQQHNGGGLGRGHIRVAVIELQ